MTIEEMIRGESKKVEFKEVRPEKSIKYIKSVVAFANSTGGTIIFGVADETREIVGIPDEIVFSEMDAIANAISDSCAPMIVPDIYFKTVDGKILIIVDVPIGSMRPYYIKNVGIEEGTYIRVSGSSRPADDYMIHELRLEGSRRSYDEMPCLDIAITESDIEKLCEDMTQIAMQNCKSDEERNNIKPVGVNQLLAWGILLERDGKFLPTNAYAILTGNERMPVAIQCGVFKGSTKAIFVDRTEFTGSAWETVEDAYRYVLKNIHLGAKFEGIYRQDVYEIPPSAIRELIVNAVVHRSYLDHNCIQVAIYDDRLEILSPGKLPKGQTLEKMQEGHSKIRNEALAKAFSYMKIIEHWGSGILRVIQEVENTGLKKPVFSDGEIDVIVTIYRDENSPASNLMDIPKDQDMNQDATKEVPKKFQRSSEEVPKKLTEQQKVIYDIILESGEVKAKEVAGVLNVSDRRARTILNEMIDAGVVEKIGATTSTRYVLVERKN
ncbi:MAG: putative DNA binding domain-containing protein [Clostridiaceae bacterium]|nr:putative DNA binding domain-containing protein [Clostridiaceae bacterium]